MELMGLATVLTDGSTVRYSYEGTRVQSSMALRGELEEQMAAFGFFVDGSPQSFEFVCGRRTYLAEIN